MRVLFYMMLLAVVGCVHTKPQTSEMYRAVVAFDIAKKIQYKADKYDYWQTPTETKKLGFGDCEDQSIYLQKLLMDSQMESLIVFGATNEGDKELHVWNEVEIYGKTYILDVTNDIFEEKSELVSKYPKSYMIAPLSLGEAQKFALNARFLKRRLVQEKDFTGIVDCIRR
jgi:hypothetical protein